MKELGNLDMAASNHSAREQWLSALKSSASQAVDEWHHSHISMKWVIMRCIRITQVHVKYEKCFKLSDSTLEAIDIDLLRTVMYDDMERVLRKHVSFNFGDRTMWCYVATRWKTFPLSCTK